MFSKTNRLQRKNRGKCLKLYLLAILETVETEINNNNNKPCMDQKRNSQKTTW